MWEIIQEVDALEKESSLDDCILPIDVRVGEFGFNIKLIKLFWQNPEEVIVLETVVREISERIDKFEDTPTYAQELWGDIIQLVSYMNIVWLTRKEELKDSLISIKSDLLEKGVYIHFKIVNNRAILNSVIYEHAILYPTVQL